MEMGPIGRDASYEEIVAASDALLGQNFGDIVEKGFIDAEATKVKGELGELLEIYYGMANDNDPAPDFRKEGIELKCKPLKTSYGDYFYPKEPLSVGMIDYAEVVETEYWRDIKKLDRKFLNLLVVWFHHDGGDRSEFPFVWWQHWSPSEDLDEQIQAEYETIRQQILEGEHLSETKAGNDILQTCPKHNYDFPNREPGSYVVNSGHPHLEKPERRSWRIPSRFLLRMLADDANLEIVPKGRSEYVKKEALWARSKERATDASEVETFLTGDSQGQSGLSDFSQ
ncbi:MutH/Sau3AI family endonuclease [Haladaptatus sp. GCM10025707]|uniref:MutH/Sau3AI family endonuclease n=1 Tax=unclassified Haladaptatus TaxID=2622732 RepID=UPI0023E7FF2C|nr:MutH/Sau3AI family endonuclease [Haladaptatus sp. QDMS2]